MDIAVLTSFLAPFLPFLMQLGNKAAEAAAGKLGEDAWNKAKAIWEKLHPKVEAKEAAKEAAKDVALNPNDEDLQAALRVQLKKLLEQDEALTKAIAQLMQEDTEADSSGTSIKQTATGDQQQNIDKVEGQNKVVGNIGNVGQDLNL
jgi:hypothetical protein